MLTVVFGSVCGTTVQSATIDTQYTGQTGFLVESADSQSVDYVPSTLQLVRDASQESGDPLRYTQFRFVLSSSNQNIAGATATVTTRVRPTLDNTTLDTNSGRCPDGVVCNAYDKEVQTSVFASRPVYRYALIPTAERIPFAFVQVDYDDALPSPPCIDTVDCREDDISRELATCTPEFIDTNYTTPDGMTSDTAVIEPQLDAICGAERDSSTVFIDDTCVKVCCHPCTNTSRVNYRRKTVHAVGPFCEAFEIGSWGVTNDVLATVRIGNNTIEDARVFTNNRPNTPDYSVSRRRTGRDLESAVVNAERTLRLQVLNHTTTEPAVSLSGGFLLVCDYSGNATSDPASHGRGDQGVYNPYVRNAFEALYKHAEESDAHAEIPYRDTLLDPISFYEAVGGGSVPTHTGLAGNGDLSWFYVTRDHYQYLRDRTQSRIYELWRPNIPEYCLVTDDRFDNNVQIPGLDTTPDAPDYPTPCQMSHAINEYAQYFNNTVYIQGLDAALANLSATYPLGAPRGLHPQFLLERPNMHVHFGADGVAELIFDPITVAARPVFAEIGVDIPDHLLPISDTNPVVEFTQGPNCAAVRVLNVTTLEEASNDEIVANISAGVAFQIRLAVEETPLDAQAALSGRLTCVEQEVQFLDYQQRSTSAADARGVFPLDVVNVGDRSEIEGFAFTFYTADLALTQFGGCSIDIYRYNAATSTPDYYQTLVASAAFTCDILQDLDNESDVEQFIRALAQDAGVIESSDSGLGTLTIVFIAAASGVLLCVCVAFGVFLAQTYL